MHTFSKHIASKSYPSPGFDLLTKNHGWLIVKILFILLFLIPVNSPLLSQNNSPYLKLNKEYVVSYFKEAGNIAVSPIKWKKRQWLGFAAATGITLITYSQDEVIRDYFQRNQTEAKGKISQYFLDPLGSYYLIGILGGMYVYGLIAKDQKTETAALVTSKAVILTGAYTFLFKSLFQRQRPDQADPANPNYWGGPFDGFHNNSFPSGHSSLVFATATVLSAYYKDKVWVGITSFSLASLVALSRGYDDRHWASDAVAGALLGYAIGRLVYNNFEKKSLGVKPFGNRYGQGITLSWNL